MTLAESRTVLENEKNERRTLPMLRGIPAALAKARETRYAQKTNGVATVSVEVNATKGNRPKE